MNGSYDFEKPEVRLSSSRRHTRSPTRETVRFPNNYSTLEDIDHRVSRCRPCTTRLQGNEWGRNPDQVQVLVPGLRVTTTRRSGRRKEKLVRQKTVERQFKTKKENFVNKVHTSKWVIKPRRGTLFRVRST